MPYVLALDQGTTSSRALVIDERGRVVGQAQREFRQFFPSPGRVEHDPEEIWESQVGTARGAIAQAGISAADLSSIGITNQRETTVVWDRASGRAIGPAIVWQDRRTAGFCDRMKADGLEPLFRERTGLVLDPYFSGTKVRWMLDHVEGARSLADAGRLAFGTVDSWLIWRLTGGRVHATDPSNASRTLLFNIHTLAWDDELLGALDIPRSILPEVRDSSGDFGQTAPGVFDAPVRLAGVAGDQQAALFGQLCLEPGMVKNTYGTGCFALMNAGGAPVASANNLLTTVAWTVGGKTTYALEGSVFVAGAVVQWLRDGLGLISSSADVETLAARVDDAGGVVFVPAFTGLGAPHWDAYARGGVMGLTRGTTSAHVARAALESIAFQSTDLIRAMEADSGVPVRELRVDGGATANDLLMQMQADFLGAPVIRPRMLETTALGAAYLAGLASGVWGSTTELAEQWQVDRRFTPGLPPEEVARRTRRWNRAVERVRRWDLDD